MSKDLLNWNNKYEFGIEDIDLQHHYFLNLINRINRLLKDSEHKDFNLRLISELNAYARFHFISEENIMMASGYPLIAEHKKQHTQLLDKLSGKQALIGLHAEQGEDIKEIVNFLSEWFSQHTLDEDIKFADFYHSQKQ